ncbi:hypothetical protein RHGRI_000981 [Rhododendron griersonianum]|uniref:Uncharacterized protein n=1 Tax=Rhododendron griersonianum TaxID=479676 RepID=A0AAV6LIK2_9ERIC|nr:hypothetical protein RHGRI_000981 [Rhododendron griersonianum]
MEEFLLTDSESLYAKVKYQEKQLKLKRRTLPESFLREDDVDFETIKAFVEKGFGACNLERDHYVDQDNTKISDLFADLRNLLSVLDDMTNKGLQLFAEVLTGGSIKFEKTRWKMKKVIRELLPQVLENWKDRDNQLADDICQLLKNPRNFKNNGTLFTPSPQLYHASVTKVLDGLEDIPSQTLSAMHRKLRGVHGYVPHLLPSKSGWGRRDLIGQVRKSCMAMLSELDEEDELPEPLAKAIAVRCLSAKLIEGCPYILPEFWKFSPEIEALQDGLAKAILLLKPKANEKGKVRFPELKNLQLLLDPNSVLPKRKLRTAVRNLLIEYLFECSDMDTVPEYLLETLSIVNRTSRRAPYGFVSKEEVEEEVEFVLSVSAQIKQVLWDLLPEFEFDLDFADAYGEDLEESDDGDAYDVFVSVEQPEVVLPENNACHSHDPYDQIETIGETDPANFESLGSPIEENESTQFLTPNRRLSSDSLLRSEPEHFTINLVDSSHSLAFKTTLSGSSSHLSPITEFDQNHVEGQEPNVDQGKPPDFVSSNLSSGVNFMHDKQSMSGNQYVAVQEACDKTSIVAYRLIGNVLDEFAQIERCNLYGGDVSYLRGDSSIRKNSEVAKDDQMDVHGSIIIQALEELLPSFPESSHHTSLLWERESEGVDGFKVASQLPHLELKLVPFYCSSGLKMTTTRPPVNLSLNLNSERRTKAVPSRGEHWSVRVGFGPGPPPEPTTSVWQNFNPISTEVLDKLS